MKGGRLITLVPTQQVKECSGHLSTPGRMEKTSQHTREDGGDISAASGRTEETSQQHQGGQRRHLSTPGRTEETSQLYQEGWRRYLSSTREDGGDISVLTRREGFTQGGFQAQLTCLMERKV